MTRYQCSTYLMGAAGLANLLGLSALPSCSPKTDLNGERDRPTSFVPETGQGSSDVSSASEPASMLGASSADETSGSAESDSTPPEGDTQAQDCEQEIAAIESGFFGNNEPAQNADTLSGAWQGDTLGESVSLVLNDDGRGTLQIGPDVTLPPIEDPQAPYLVDQGDTFGSPSQWQLRRGFKYNISAVEVTKSRITLVGHGTQPWSAWCAAQPPVKHNGCGWGCEPNLGHTVVSDKCVYGNGKAVDCRRVAMCNTQDGACECVSSGCVADPWKVYVWQGRLNADGELDMMGGGLGRPYLFTRADSQLASRETRSASHAQPRRGDQRVNWRRTKSVRKEPVAP